MPEIRTQLTPFAEMYREILSEEYPRNQYGHLARRLNDIARDWCPEPETQLVYWREYLKRLRDLKVRTGRLYFSPTKFWMGWKFWAPEFRRALEIDAMLDKQLAEKERNIAAREGGTASISDTLKGMGHV